MGLSKRRVTCDNDHYFDFIGTRHHVRWMDHVLYILYGHDIDHLTKDELKKVVVIQNTKMLEDNSDLDKYQAQERNFARQIEQFKADCSKKDEQIKSLNNHIATLGKDGKRHDDKLDKANSEVSRLTEELKDKQDALLKLKNDLTKQIADKVAENVKLDTQLA